MYRKIEPGSIAFTVALNLYIHQLVYLYKSWLTCSLGHDYSDVVSDLSTQDEKQSREMICLCIYLFYLKTFLGLGSEYYDVDELQLVIY